MAIIIIYNFLVNSEDQHFVGIKILRTEQEKVMLSTGNPSETFTYVIHQEQYWQTLKIPSWLESMQMLAAITCSLFETAFVSIQGILITTSSLKPHIQKYYS